MATIAENLQTIKDSTAAIKQSIINKGGEIRGNITTWASAIDNIKTGGGGGEVTTLEEKDVNFYDYDGTLLFAYTIPEAQALTELPTPKGHSGLIFDGWNWDYEDVIALDYPMNIGAMYVTDDGCSRFYLSIENEHQKQMYLFLQPNNANGLTIDWGDGIIEITSSVTSKMSHRYENLGDFVIKITASADYNFSTNVLGDSVIHYAERLQALRKVEFGERVKNIYTNAFNNAVNLKSVSFPKGVNISNTSVFNNCSSLRGLTIPNGNQIVGNSILTSCSSLRVCCIPNSVTRLDNNALQYSSVSSLCIPKGVTSLGSYTFPSCNNLHKVVIPQSVSAATNNVFQACISLSSVDMRGVTLGNYAFQNCSSLRVVNLAEGFTTIGNSTFQNCLLIQSIRFPISISSIGASAFAGLSRCLLFDFSLCEKIPVITGSNAFQSVPSQCKIVVPDALYNEWIAATNWSTYASYIVKASEYVEQ
jgi:hypothetical protein